jgi:hypothetical protein
MRTRARGPHWVSARFDAMGCQSYLFKVIWGEFESRRANPTIHLLRRAGADDGP